MLLQAFSKVWSGPRPCIITDVNQDGSVNAAVFLSLTEDRHILAVCKKPYSGITGPLIAPGQPAELLAVFREYVVDEPFKIALPTPKSGDALVEYATQYAAELAREVAEESLRMQALIDG